ncbi:unnamed protein product, partial [Nesidiocoris tenuis]
MLRHTEVGKYCAIFPRRRNHGDSGRNTCSVKSSRPRRGKRMSSELRPEGDNGETARRRLGRRSVV